jgi:predicted DNA-binding WGR domain protein
MSDEELRALERAARESDDATSWLHLAQAAARAGKGDEAGAAASRARAKGADVTPMLDALAPGTLEDFSVRELGKRFELGKLYFTAWSPDATTLYAVENKKAILAIDPASGARRTVATLPGEATAFAASVDSKRLALGLVTPEKGKLVNGLAVLDPETEKLDRIGRGHSWIHQVAIARDTILCAEKQRLRGYVLSAPEKAVLSFKGTAALDPTGAFAITLGTELHLHDVASAEPRVTIGLDVPAEGLARFHLATAGDRTVVVAEEIVVLEKTGAPRARAPLSPASRIYDVVPSPSGKHVAIFFAENNQRTTRLDLLDVGAGKTRTFELGARPRWASWSASGRRLAVPTDQGVVVLVEAASTAAPPPAPPPRATPDDGWVELRSSQRFWRARRYGALVEFHHGLLGTRGTRGATPCLDEDEAKRELERRILEKRESGYRE